MSRRRSQVPVALYKVEGTAKLIYFSRYEDRHAKAIDEVYCFDTAGGAATNLELWDSTPRWIGADRELHGDGADMIRVPALDKPGNGRWWRTVDAQEPLTLTRLSLTDYNIVHDDTTGELVSIKPKG